MGAASPLLFPSPLATTKLSHLFRTRHKLVKQYATIFQWKRNS